MSLDGQADASWEGHIVIKAVALSLSETVRRVF